MKFICSFVWADLEVSDEERRFVINTVRRLDMNEDERSQVMAWLQVPPPADEVDPGLVPAGHRRLFVNAVTQLVKADNRVARDEQLNLSLFERLLN
ncbi:MAG: TerB family tellurite resistance protein [Gammaproteobacteria bacterium]|nr:TerB family tellurite resistance protein [Gammaproteobacteria bacterium]